MWVKLDDGLLDHRKLLEAGHALGRDGRAKALGFYASGLLYTNKHLTDGFLSQAVVDQLHFVEQPRKAAGVMVAVGLWEAVEGGYRIHDFHDFNPPAEKVFERRKADRERKKRGGRNRHHNGNGDDH
jgi:hypothetical protein